MSNIDPPASWADVDGINTNERLLGGPSGPLNRAVTGLAARTKQLRDDQIAATTGVRARTSILVTDFANLITSKPNPTDPSTWDWAPAMRAAILQASSAQLASVVLPYGVYATSPIYLDTPVSNLHFDGCGSLVRCIGPRTRGTRFDWEYGIFNFHGQYVGASVDVTLSQAVTERSRTFVVPDGTFFQQGQFYLVEFDPANDPDAGGTFSTKRLWKILQVVTTTSTSVTFDYDVAYDLAVGTVVRFRQVDPVENILFENVELEFALPYTPGDPTSQQQASSGVTFLLAYNCKASNVVYRKNPKQAVHFELTHSCAADRISSPDSIEINSGGYCVQFEKSVYFRVSRCWDRRGRHTFDATASAYGSVSDCHGFESQNVAFTTHGTFEHNIVYERCEGGFQLAGSGVNYGESAKRITVRNHTGPNYKGLGNVHDVTLEDCRFYSTSDVNADGFQALRTTFAFDVRFVKTSTLSARASEVVGGVVTANSGFFQLMTGALTLRQCQVSTLTSAAFQTLDATPVQATGSLSFIDCDLSTTSASNLPVNVALSQLTVRGGTMVGTIFAIQGAANQEYSFSGCLMGLGSRPTSQNVLLVDKSAGTLDLLFAPRRSDSAGRHITAIRNGAVIRARILNADINGGSVRIDATALSSTGSLITGGNVYRTVTKTLPAVAANVVYGTDLDIP